MQVKAAVAYEIGKPLVIEMVELEGPKKEKYSSKLRLQGFVILMHLHYLVMILKGFFQLF